MTNATMNTTANEMLMLRAIFDSEFHSLSGAGRIGYPVWSDCTQDSKLLAGMSRAARGGVASSLGKKGLAGFQQDADGDICWITAAGFEALVAAGFATK